MSAGRHTSERGQALIETAIVVVFCLSLFVGVYAWTVAYSDSTAAGLATRSGARFAAQIGNDNYTVVALDPCQGGDNTNPCAVDSQIVAAVADGITSLRFATVKRIVIYQPAGGSAQCSSSNGLAPNSPYASGDLAEIYTPASGGGWSWSNPGGPAYTLDKRIQTHPNESAIGIQLEFDYKSPTPLVQAALIGHVEFTVNCLAPSSH
jgi:hypothetical protein